MLSNPSSIYDGVICPAKPCPAIWVWDWIGDERTSDFCCGYGICKDGNLTHNLLWESMGYLISGDDLGARGITFHDPSEVWIDSYWSPQSDGLEVISIGLFHWTHIISQLINPAMDQWIALQEHPDEMHGDADFLLQEMWGRMGPGVLAWEICWNLTNDMVMTVMTMGAHLCTELIHVFFHFRI